MELALFVLAPTLVGAVGAWAVRPASVAATRLRDMGRQGVVVRLVAMTEEGKPFNDLLGSRLQRTKEVTPAVSPPVPFSPAKDGFCNQEQSAEYGDRHKRHSKHQSEQRKRSRNVYMDHISRLLIINA